jgi:hopanoid biosynthesis associated protein HpnK
MGKSTINAVRRLIINADDLGMTSGINRAVEVASRARALTSATLMASSQAFDDAVALAKAMPTLGIGCHIVLVDGEPLSTGLQTLTNGTPRFRTSLKNFALAAVCKRLPQDEIQREAEAQIGKIQTAGITLTHVDTHKHTHIFPHVLDPVLKAAAARGICAIRNPFEPSRAWPKALIAAKPALWTRTLEVVLLQRFSADFRRMVNEYGFATTDGTVGIIATGHLDQQMLLRTIAALPEGTWELVCHPGYVDGDLRRAGTRLVNSRRIELEALTSEETREALKKRGTELISYAELKATGHRQ